MILQQVKRDMNDSSEVQRCRGGAGFRHVFAHASRIRIEGVKSLGLLPGKLPYHIMYHPLREWLLANREQTDGIWVFAT